MTPDVQDLRPHRLEQRSSCLQVRCIAADEADQLTSGRRFPGAGHGRIQETQYLACASDAIFRENEGLTVLQSTQSASGRRRSRNPLFPSAASWTAPG